MALRTRFIICSSLLCFLGYNEDNKGKTSGSRVRFSDGKVQGTKSLISYEGTTCKELVKDFKEAIDDYLDMCKRKKIKPETSYKGTFNIRINPELHKKAYIYASSYDMTLNGFVEESIKEKLEVA